MTSFLDHSATRQIDSIQLTDNINIKEKWFENWTQVLTILNIANNFERHSNIGLVLYSNGLASEVRTQTEHIEFRKPDSNRTIRNLKTGLEQDNLKAAKEPSNTRLVRYSNGLAFEVRTQTEHIEFRKPDSNRMIRNLKTGLVQDNLKAAKEPSNTRLVWYSNVYCSLLIGSSLILNIVHRKNGIYNKYNYVEIQTR